MAKRLAVTLIFLWPFFAVPVRAATIIAEQLDGSVSSTIASGCNNACGNVTFGTQSFVPQKTAPLGSIKVFTANFSTQSRFAETNGCFLSLYEEDAGAFVAQSDNGFAGGSCAGDLTFSFVSSTPVLQAGKHYRWNFIFGVQNFSTLTFFGSATNTVGGVFNVPPVVNAKFIALSGIPKPTLGLFRQFRSDGVREMVEGATTTEPTVVLGAVLHSSSTDRLRLEVELQPIGASFTGVPTATSTTVASGDFASTTIAGLMEGAYHWQARAADMTADEVSPWQEFGAAGNSDFTVDALPPRGFVQTDSAATSIGSWYDDNWYQLGRGFDATITTLTLEGAVNQREYFSSHIHLSEFSDPGYKHLTHSYVVSDNAPFVWGTFTRVTFSDLNIPLDANKYYRLDTVQDYQNRSVILRGTNATGTAMWNEFVYGTGKVEYPYVFYPYIVANVVPREPVVLVPGIMGSRLARAAGGGEVWPNAEEMKNSASDSYLDVLKLDLNGNPIPGKEITTTDILRDATATFLGIPFNGVFYKNLIDALTEDGYREGRDLFIAPYDWRLGTGSSTGALAEKIDQAVAASPDGKINIIAHSMGGLLVKAYLAAHADNSFLNKLVLAGVPQLGAPKAFKLLHYGDDMGLRWFFFGLNPNEAKSIAQNMLSVYELLPTARYVRVAGGYVQDFRGGSSRVLGYEETAGLMKSDPSDSLNPALLGAADSFHQGLDAQAVNAANVYNIVGCLTPTISSFNLYDNGVVTLTREAGDGTVPEVSAMNLANDFHNYFVLGGKTGIDHTGLVRDARPLTLIKNILHGVTATTSLPAGISTSLPDCLAPGSGGAPPAGNETTIEFSVHGPVASNIYDAEGRHTGPMASGDVELGIPGSTYDKIGENTFILVPSGEKYRALVRGMASGTNSSGIFGSGTFEMKVKEYEGNSVSKQATYLSVAVVGVSTTAELHFSDFSGNMELALDSDGDGAVDATAQPDAILSASSSAADVTPPTLVLPHIPAQVVRGSTTTLQFGATDEGSGVGAVKATLNGEPVMRDAAVAFTRTGNNVFTLTAVDKAGNPRTGKVDFEVVVPVCTPRSGARTEIDYHVRWGV